MDDIERAQIDYYRARAAEYDEWYFRRGRYDQGAERNAAWFADVATVEAALTAAKPRGTILDIACGTGLWTGHLAARADRITALDAARETLELNRVRVDAANIDYVEADIFAWRPAMRYDFIFFGFWISHIPAARWDGFWAMLESALAPNGTIFFVDNHAKAYRGESERGTQDGDAVEERTLNDGRRFTIVKNFFVPAELEAELGARGWHGYVRETDDFLIYGAMSRSARAAL